jgi:tetratricopeptide (TPR) repeat protein
MLTNEATYLKVAEAAESSVDSYIVRPYSAGSLYDRIEQARLRKAALYPIYRALEEQRYEDAIGMCQTRFQERGAQWLQAARLGAEILLRLERFDEAEKLFQAIWDADPKPWAKLGVVRTQLDSGNPYRAKETLAALIEAEPDYPEAYDVLGRVQMELGQFQTALDNLEKAVAITPMAIGRLQRLGMLAYFCGDRHHAEDLLERSTYLGLDSKMFDGECLVLLALSAFQQGSPAQVERHLAELRKRLRSNAMDVRLKRFTDTVTVLSLVLQMHKEKAKNLAHALCKDIDAPDFDMEAACNLLAMLSLVEHHGLTVEDDQQVVERLGRRFATSKAMGELLANAASAHPPFADKLRSSQDEMVQRIEKSVRQASDGQPDSALVELYQTASTTLNAKAVESAWLVLQRYAGQIPNASDMQAKVGQLREGYGTARNKPALGDKRLRPSGGVNLGPMDRPAPTASEDA